MWSHSSQYSIAAKERRRDKPSPAYQIISLFHQHEGFQQGKSNIRTDHAGSEILRVCIRFGVRFDLDDLEVIHGARESEYALACGAERGILNPSAAHAYEKFHDRKPFMIEDPGNTTPTRIYVGRKFYWKGKEVTCTSFAIDGLSLTACSYKGSNDPDDYSKKIDQRFRVSNDDIRDFRTEQRQKLKELTAQLSS